MGYQTICLWISACTTGLVALAYYLKGKRRVVPADFNSATESARLVAWYTYYIGQTLRSGIETTCQELVARYQHINTLFDSYTQRFNRLDELLLRIDRRATTNQEKYHQIATRFQESRRQQHLQGRRLQQISKAIDEIGEVVQGIRTTVTQQNNSWAPSGWNDTENAANSWGLSDPRDNNNQEQEQEGLRHNSNNPHWSSYINDDVVLSTTTSNTTDSPEPTGNFTRENPEPEEGQPKTTLYEIINKHLDSSKNNKAQRVRFQP